MENTLCLNSIQKEKNKAIFKYDISGEWEKYFETAEPFFVEYPFSIEDVPDGILTVIFLSNFLPIIWLCDAKARVFELDKDFFSKLHCLKKGYMDMYPYLKFEGEIISDNVIDYSTDEKSGSALFFSGGVDAYTSLLRHIEEKPILVTLWGPDVDVYNEEGWKIVADGIQNAANDYDLEFIPVRTSIKKVINEPRLTGLVAETKDNWYHAFQHGIAIISHMAPIAYKRKLAKAYIASSYPEYAKGTYTCASDPTIDNHMNYCGCKTIHDGYELDRQQKLNYIVGEKRKHNYPIHLHVCWESSGGKNCCSCEKCYRTIIGIVAEGANPREYGFDWSKDRIKKMKSDLLLKIRVPQNVIDSSYLITQKIILENKESIPDYKWFTDIDFRSFNNSLPKRIYHSRIMRKIREVF